MSLHHSVFWGSCFRRAILVYEEAGDFKSRTSKETMNIHSSLINSGVLEQAQTQIEEQLLSNSKSEKLKESLVQIYRKLGKLKQSFALREDMNRPQFEEGEAPVWVVSSWLEEELCQEIFEQALLGSSNATPSRVGSGEHRPEQRTSLNLKMSPRLTTLIRARVSALVPSVLEQFRMVNFPIAAIEVKMRAYSHGHFFAMHHDDAHNRKLSFVYFFHPEPRRFVGGDLVVVDGEEEVSDSGFARVIPVRNTLVVFPSKYYHTVIPVTCGPEFLSSRMVVNGHVQEEKN